MTGYLTNLSLSDREFVEAAAKETGYNVEFRDYPIPYNGTFDDEGYCRERLIGSHGSVYTNEPAARSHSPFWRAYERAKYGRELV